MYTVSISVYIQGFLQKYSLWLIDSNCVAYTDQKSHSEVEIIMHGQCEGKDVEWLKPDHKVELLVYSYDITKF